MKMRTSVRGVVAGLAVAGAVAFGGGVASAADPVPVPVAPVAPVAVAPLTDAELVALAPKLLPKIQDFMKVPAVAELVKKLEAVPVVADLKAHPPLPFPWEIEKAAKKVLADPAAKAVLTQIMAVPEVQAALKA